MIERAVGSTCLVTLALVSTTGAAAGQQTWSVSAEATVEIGSADGAAPSLFHDVRGAVKVAEGLLAVGDGGSREIRIFTASGQFVRSFGGQGDGPNEFRGIGWIDMCGGQEIVAYDFARHRITKWTPLGDLVEEFAVAGPDHVRPPYSVDCGNSDEVYVVVGWPDIMAYAQEVGPYRPTVSIGTVDGLGKTVRRIGTFAGPERYRYPNNDGPRRLGKTTTARIHDGVVFVGTADEFQLQRFDSDGSVHLFGKDADPVEVTGAIARAWEDDIVERTPEAQRRQARRTVRALELPETLPAYSTFLVDTEGYVWVARYPVPGIDEHGAGKWDIFDDDGVWSAEVALGEGFTPTEIGPDYVLGVHVDMLGVETVRLFDLEREQR